MAHELDYFGDDVGWACTAEVLLDAGYGIATNRPNSVACGPLQSRLRVRIDCAPPSSLRFEAFSGEVRKLRACSGDAQAPSAPEIGHMPSRGASLRFSLCGRVIRCRCRKLDVPFASLAI